MQTNRQRTIRVGMTVGLSLGAIVGLLGCHEMSDATEGSHQLAVETANGLYGTNGISGINGLYGTNGISGVNGVSGVNGISGVNGVMGVNGISSVNGISGVNGLSETSGLMTTDAGRKTVAYLTKCALASGDTLIKKDQNGTQYTFNGSLGLCPAWKNGGIHGTSYRTCQNLVSACLMAHINTSGVHVPLWLDSESPLIGWGVSTTYPKQEGTFFGNLIETGDLSGLGMTGVSGPKAYFCEGAGITAGVVSGRLGSGQSGAPYVNPYGTNVQCSSTGGNVAAGPVSAGMTAPDGYKQACANGYCFQNGEPITVWRNPSYTPVFDPVYSYSLMPMSVTGKSVDISGTTVRQYTSAATDSQRIKIVTDGASNWKMTLVADATKCLGPVGGTMVSGADLEVQACTGTTIQSWIITADANTGGFTMKNVSNQALCMEVTDSSTSDGALIQVNTCGTGSNQKFKVASSYSDNSGGSTGTTGTAGSTGTTSTFDSNTTYRMVPQHATAESVDVCNNSQTNGTCVQQYSGWNTDSQKFFIRASGSNWAFSMKGNSAKCFGLVGNGTANGTQVEIQDCNGSSFQAWTAVLVSGTTSTYNFKNAGAYSRCLDVTGLSTANGARMQVYDCGTGNNQKFAVSAAP